MNAKRQAKRLRAKLGLSGRADISGAANMLGLSVIDWHLPSDEIHDAIVENHVAVARDLDEPMKRWAVAHAIGHHVMHSRHNSLWLRAHTLLSDKLERQAETFSYNLLVNEAEILSEGLKTAPEIAAYFGVPVEMVQVQGRLV